MITSYRHIDTVGGLRSSQRPGHMLYSAPAMPHPERLAHTGALTRRNRAGAARCGRRRATVAVLLLLTALALGVLALSARPAAGAVDGAPKRPPCPVGWAYRLQCRQIGTFLVCVKMCVRETRK